MTFELRILDACALATSVSAVSLLLLLPLSRRLGLVDHPDPFRKRHAFDTPLVGGLAIAVGMLAGWWCLGTPSKFEDAVVCTALMLVVVGVADDLFNLRVSVRVIAQLSAIAIVVISSGVYIHSLGILHGHELTLGWLGIPFTVIAVIGLLNAFNHPQFVTGSPNQALSVSITGSERNYLIPSSPNFQNARVSFASNARQMVIGAKLTF